MGKQWKQWQTLFSWVPKLLQMVTATMKLKDAWSLEEKLYLPRQHIKKQRHYYANKDPSSQSYDFSSRHVWMWELDYKENRAPKNWCFWTVVLEKTESPLDCKEIQPVHPKGNQSWIFIVMIFHRNVICKSYIKNISSNIHCLFSSKCGALRKAEQWGIDAFELWCWRRLRVPWTAWKSNQSIPKENNPE